jgi:hypothetical protein
VNRKYTARWLLPLMLATGGCGSSYEHNTLEIVTDRWDAGTEPLGTCEDGSRCYNYRYSELTGDGIVRNLYGCRPGHLSGETSKNFFCKLHSSEERQLSDTDLEGVKKTVIEANPPMLGNLYHCVCNDTCTDEFRQRWLFVTIDGEKTSTSWTGGGASASRQLSDILRALEKVGLL